MQRHRAIGVWVGLLVLASLACNAFAGEPKPGLLLPPPGGTAVLPTPSGLNIAPTVTLPAQSAPATNTAVVPANPNGAPTVRMLVDLNIRSGPGVQFTRVGFLSKGETAVIIGRHAATGWWRIQCPPLADGTSCWVSGGPQYSAATGAENVPDVPAPTAVPAGGNGRN